MTIAKPRWWEYIIMEDVDGVGVVTGFKEGTPQDIIDEYFEYLDGVGAEFHGSITDPVGVHDGYLVCDTCRIIERH